MSDNDVNGIDEAGKGEFGSDATGVAGSVGRHSRDDEPGLNGARLGASFRKRRFLPTRRSLLVLFVVALFLAGVMIDRNVEYTPPAGPPDYVSGASPSDATSSAWYCPMVPASRATPGGGAVFIVNPNETSLSGTATFFPQGGEAVDVKVNVASKGRVALRPGEVVDAPFAATLLRFNGGGAAVEHIVSTPQGPAYTPCATQASEKWYFADGSTQSGASLQIGLFNPFLEDTIADISFITNDGNVAPDEFQGVVIPARSFTSVNVSDRVRRRDWLATTVTARSGRLVVSELQTGVVNNVPGTGLTLGATSAENTWYLPDGESTPGFGDQLSLFNPGDDEAAVSVSLLIDKGSVEPFQLRVPAHARIALNYDKEPRVPADANFGVVVRSLNNVPVVAQRVAIVGPPLQRNGAFFQMATTETARRWIVALNETKPPWDDWVYVINDNPTTAKVKVTGVSPNGQLASSEGTVQSGRRLLIHVNEFAADNSNPGLVIESDLPVVAGRTLSAIGGQGVNSSLAIPVR